MSLPLSPFPNVVFSQSTIANRRHFEQGCALSHRQYRAAQYVRLRCSAQGEYDCFLDSQLLKVYMHAPVCAYCMLVLRCGRTISRTGDGEELASSGSRVCDARLVAAIHRELARSTLQNRSGGLPAA